MERSRHQSVEPHGAGPRHEVEPPRRLVSLGERFSLFSPESTVQQRSSEGSIPVFHSLLTLDSDEVLPALPFQLSTSVWSKPFHEALTPFEPDAGYHLSREDYDPVLRPLLRQRLLHDFSQRDIPVIRWCSQWWHSCTGWPGERDQGLP